MTNQSTFLEYAARLRDFICQNASGIAAEGSAPSNPKTEFQPLALELFGLQFAHNSVYRRFCQTRKATPETVHDWRHIPAMPTVAFKEFELTSLPVAERTHVFHSSGTTDHRPGRHFHNAQSLALYEDSLRPWFQAHLLALKSEAVRFLMLAPPPAQAQHSSLVHMFETVSQKFAPHHSCFTGEVDHEGGWDLDLPRTLATLKDAVEANHPMVLLGTAFNFVHLLDCLAQANLRLQLPPGSRVMETGGYKGRSRSLPKAELHSLITQRLGVPPHGIICEYGMSELSSQAYDHAFRSSPDSPRGFSFPPWARVQIVSPETGREAAEAETGLIRIFDLANVHSVMAIQTEDLGIRRGSGFELIGRATQAEPRGCSLMSAAAYPA
jgi:hypothetical protein